MTQPNLAFIYLTRHAGEIFDHLAHEIAACTRTRDHVLLVDDGSLDDTGAQALAFGALHGWGPDVTYDHIVLGTAIKGGFGCAINIALTRLAENPPDYVMFLQAGSRLDPAAFDHARAHLDQHPDAVICPMDHWSIDMGRVISPPPQPMLWGMMMRWGAVAQVRCDEDAAAFDDLPLLWTISQGTCLQVTDPIGYRAAPPDVDGHLGAAISRLIASAPQATSWVADNLPALTQAALPAARASLAAAGFARKTRVYAPAVDRRAPLQVLLWGEHQRRIPLSYPHLAPLWAEAATRTDNPAQADLILAGHPRDVMHARLPDTKAPVAILSEEPFWDTLFSPDPLARAVTLHGPAGPQRLHQVTHHRSAIFDFDHIPYFILTEPHYVARYAQMFARNAAYDAATWQDAFAARATDTVFMAERRPEAFHDLTIPAGDITGLCAWRTQLAEAVQEGVTERIGASWTGAATRFSLDDWHADKLQRLDGHARVISAVENTHQPTYLSEKLFDAFACGARPLYYASQGHRVHDLDLPAGAWVNLWDLDSSQAAAQVNQLDWPETFFTDYATAQKKLAQLFCDPALLVAERNRLGHAIQTELRRLTDIGPA